MHCGPPGTKPRYSTAASEVYKGQKQDKLDAIRHAMRVALVHAPLSPDLVAEANDALDSVHRAPRFLTSFPQIKEVLSLAQVHLAPAAQVVCGTGLPLSFSPPPPSPIIETTIHRQIKPA